MPRLNDLLKEVFGFLPSLLDATSVKEEVSKEVMENLKKRFPEISPPEKLEEIVKVFLELLREESYRFVPSPQDSQERKIQGFVAKTIQERFKLTESVAKNISLHLLYRDDPEKQKELVQYPVSSNDMELVKSSLLGIDVLYERLSINKWQYTTRIFVKSGDKNLKYESMGDLPLDSLPNQIRETFIREGEKQDKQRFVLYIPKEK